MLPDPKRPLIAIVGPTAVGKSELALSLAQRFRGEIVNADSRQVYRHMDIGTAKPTPQEQTLVPHHLIDVVEPDSSFGLAQYLALAQSTLGSCWSRRRLPILVGGTGQYVWALLEGWQPPRVAPDPALRLQLEERAKAKGSLALFQKLSRADPEAARRIDSRNLRRVVRALEVYITTGKPSSSLRSRSPLDCPVLVLGLTTARQKLYQRIDTRIEAMVERGWLTEVQCLLASGCSLDLPSMSSVGYRELALHLQGNLALPDAIQHIKQRTHRFVRHQYAWFRLSDLRIRWLEAGDAAMVEAEGLVQAFLGRVSLERDSSKVDNIKAIEEATRVSDAFR